ncbi:ComEC/Rec2 family competence protein [Corynebacterium doosanense]|uniref:Competence protein ComE n=1 Tax=Corynebacterium doosanense CAU 212 = DSM 45436 TaxID=558173 RepID=A0A097IHM7_9CORY|nr:ComEC/Rec2 family competence protein [Corynebacterium doosanense]AIT61623.1 competence protein ComE [Corynebacterium doosanense CAU 212 = DSM 45436]
MSELRLLPAALTCWGALIALLLTRESFPAYAVILAVSVLILLLREHGQALFTGSVGLLVVGAGDVRRRVAEAFSAPPEFPAAVTGAPSVTSSGSVLLEVRVAGYPGLLPVFTEDPEALELGSGTPVTVAAGLSPSGRPGLGLLVANGEVTPVGEPAGVAAFAGAVRRAFAESVSAHVPGEHRGLIPGMTLGDTSLQSDMSTDLYLQTGLSHLSAVSGANVAVVTTTALLLCRALSLGPRVQVAAAVGALLAYVCLVGTEPSILRAAVTGVVGLVAVIASSRMQPVHALSVAVLVLLVVDPGLAVDFGFALSVAATAGIVALMPVIARPLMPAGLPPVLARALAVAIAADAVTMPIIALMTGEVSLVSVLANVLVAPAAAPVTVLGLLATVLSLVPGPWEVPVLWLITPLTWWIHTVARVCAALPLVSVAAAPATVLLVYGWVIAGLVSRRVLLTTGCVALGAVWLAWPSISSPTIDPGELHTATVAGEEDVGAVPAGTQLIIVEDARGEPADRPTVTRDGVPVLYPNRDGPVTLHRDGTQHAADGRF